MDSAAVQIFVRFRPVQTTEEVRTDKIRFLDDGNIEVDDSIASHEPSTPSLSHTGSSVLRSRYLRREHSFRHKRTPLDNNQVPSLRTVHGGKFHFHRILDETATNDDLYQSAAPALLTAFFQGINITCMAYGASGSGKTHSMSGYFDVAHPEQQGMIPRLLADVFKQRNIRKASHWHTTIDISCIQIYMEKVLDLFVTRDFNVDPDKQPSLLVRAKLLPDKSSEIYVQDATWKTVANVEETLALITEAQKNRIVAHTGMNDVSSRSHMVFMIRLDQMNHNTGQHLQSKAFLVDLAGSETVSRSGAEGKILKQAIHVNKSLSTLSSVIKALSRNSKHVPYRDSKLTRLLTNSLGGNAKTVIILACSMSVKDLVYTVSTLNFGKRASTMPNKPTINKVLTIADYKRMLSHAEAQIKEHKLTIQALRHQNDSMLIRRQSKLMDVNANLLAAAKESLSDSESLSSILMAEEDNQTSKNFTHTNIRVESDDDSEQDSESSDSGPPPLVLTGRAVDRLSRSSAALSDHVVEVVRARNHVLEANVRTRDEDIEHLHDQLVELRDMLHQLQTHDTSGAKVQTEADNSHTINLLPQNETSVNPTASTSLSEQDIGFVSFGAVATAAALIALIVTQVQGKSSLVSTWILVILLAIGTLFIGLAL